MSSLTRNLQIACVQHFSMEPLSFMLVRSIVEEENKVAFSYYSFNFSLYNKFILVQ